MDGQKDNRGSIFKSFSARNLPSFIHANEVKELGPETDSASELLNGMDKETDMMDKDIPSMPYSMNASCNTDSGVSNRSSILFLSPRCLKHILLI
jgi:hypothetical protein